MLPDRGSMTLMFLDYFTLFLAMAMENRFPPYCHIASLKLEPVTFHKSIEFLFQGTQSVAQRLEQLRIGLGLFRETLLGRRFRRRALFRGR